MRNEIIEKFLRRELARLKKKIAKQRDRKMKKILDTNY